MEEKVFTFIKQGPFNVVVIARELGVNYPNFTKRLNGKLGMNKDEVKRLESYMRKYGFKKSKG